MKTLKKNLHIILIAVGVVFVWRGIWDLADIYLLPDNPQLSFLVSVMVGIVLLFLIDIKKRDVSELN